MRSIKMLGIALAINNKNRTAWTQLVDAYQSKGMNFRVKKTQQDMMAQLGESVMVELYGEAVVKELLKP
jgi:DNA phosphorothioation-dependent restriction protein DptG